MRKDGRRDYASEYILEYTFQKTEPARLRHFLAPYAEKLRAEPELAVTAEALIANDMNVILTAEKMYVHRKHSHASRGAPSRTSWN